MKGLSFMYKRILYQIMALSIFVGTASNIYAQTWEELFKKKEMLFKAHPELEIIKKQYAAFKNGTAPKIADDVIKNIPIHECGEHLVDIKKLSKKYPRITMMPDPEKPFESDSCNSGLANASKMRATIFSHLVNMVAWLDEFSGDFGYERNQMIIKVFEGLRHLKTQEILFNNKKAAIMAANPAMTDEEAEAETSKWVSPVKNNVPVHSTGAAVDIRLWDTLKKDYVDAAKFGVIWGDNKSAPTFSENITDEQKNNRFYFLAAAAKASLTNYPMEHWHVGDHDKVSAFWREDDPNKRVALYGPCPLNQE